VGLRDLQTWGTLLTKYTNYPLRNICEIPQVDTPGFLAVSANDTPYPLMSFWPGILLNFGRGDLPLPDCTPVHMNTRYPSMLPYVMWCESENRNQYYMVKRL
jgi:hypothetical protein